MNRKFEYINRILSTGYETKEADFELPKRSTKNSMAYDIYSPESFEVKPKESYMLKTGIKAYMREDEGLILNVRSSMGKKHIMLANTNGWIDSDFYNNENNERRNTDYYSIIMEKKYGK
jgi:dUTPase